MSKLPLVTIIVPVYNVGKYIDICIQSVLSQTYEKIEFILVDDGSPDNAGSVCDTYAKNDHRIKVIHKKNGGVSSARNAGLSVAQGSYIMFIDGDDWVDSDHVEYMLALCQKNNSLMSMSYGIYTSETNNQDEPTIDQQRFVSGIDMAADLLFHKTVIGSYNKLFKRELIYDNSIRFNEGLFIGEGFNFIVMCAQLSNTVSTGTRKTYHYRLDNAESAMTKFNIEKVRNNDMALNAIKQDFVVESRKLVVAWNYARWITSLSFSAWMGLSGSKDKYSNDYKKMLNDIRIKAPWVLVSSVSVGKKITAILAFISPSLVVYFVEYKRKKKVTTSV